MNRLNAMIYKTRLNYWSHDRDIKEIIRKYYTNHLRKSSQYIQKIYSEEDNQMIICFFAEAAHYLFTSKIFEIDMTFKRVKIKNMNEVLFATYLIDIDKDKHSINSHQSVIDKFLVMIFVRVFVNREISFMYCDLFTRVFAIIEERINRSVRWKHIHDEKFLTIVMNMNSKQTVDEKFTTCSKMLVN